MKPVASDTDSGYLRGLLGARLANKDNWIIVMAGSKDFVTFITKHIMQRKPMKGDMLIGPHPIIAANIPGHPELWLIIGFQTKKEDPAEAQKEHRAVERQLKVFGIKGVLPAEKDIFVFLEPGCPSWAEGLVANYLNWIYTGKGEMEAAV